LFSLGKDVSNGVRRDRLESIRKRELSGGGVRRLVLARQGGRRRRVPDPLSEHLGKKDLPAKELLLERFGWRLPLRQGNSRRKAAGPRQKSYLLGKRSRGERLASKREKRGSTRRKEKGEGKPIKKRRCLLFRKLLLLGPPEKATTRRENQKEGEEGTATQPELFFGGGAALRKSPHPIIL